MVISETDKSNNLTLSTRESYSKQGSVHTKGDKLSNWEEVRKSKSVVLAHTKAVCNIFKIGSNNTESEETRVRLNMMEDITTVPPATLQQKDHKLPIED